MRHAHNAVNHELPAHGVFESHNRAQSYPPITQWGDCDHIACLNERRHAAAAGGEAKSSIFCQYRLHQRCQITTRDRIGLGFQKTPLGTLLHFSLSLRNLLTCYYDYKFIMRFCEIVNSFT